MTITDYSPFQYTSRLRNSIRLGREDTDSDQSYGIYLNEYHFCRASLAHHNRPSHENMCDLRISWELNDDFFRIVTRGFVGPVDIYRTGSTGASGHMRLKSLDNLLGRIFFFANTQNEENALIFKAWMLVKRYIHRATFQVHCGPLTLSDHASPFPGQWIYEIDQSCT